MSHLILFDDGYEHLAPLTDLRASFELRTGALTTAERIAEQFGKHASALLAPQGLAHLMLSRHTEPVNVLPAGERFTFINGRWPRLDRPLPTQVNTALLDTDGSVMAGVFDRPHAADFVAGHGALPDDVEGVTVDSPAMLTRPWHILQRSSALLDFDLTVLAKRLMPLTGDPAPRVTVVGKHPVLVGRGAVVHPHVVFDTSAGPIAIDDHAEIRSMGVLVGPGYVGRRTAITNHAHIRGHCVIGPVCKVGGEVNASIFQGYANKAHSGYLGNSFVGEWVNLGADTVTSNLKNTYGEIRVQRHPGGPGEATGMSHLGSIIGDHVKTAIGTRLSTGSVVHTGAMLALSSFPPKCVDRFAFLTDGGAEKYELEKFIEVAEAMMGRRNLEVTPALRQRLEALHGTA